MSRKWAQRMFLREYDLGNYLKRLARCVDRHTPKFVNRYVLLDGVISRSDCLINFFLLSRVTTTSTTVPTTTEAAIDYEAKAEIDYELLEPIQLSLKAERPAAMSKRKFAAEEDNHEDLSLFLLPFK